MSETVSIIIPAYNVGKYIQECLNSLLSQTYQNLEIVVIDDGSIDETYEIVKAYSNKFARLILVHQENGGVCAARNKGLDLASGEYIMFLDADDYLLPETIEIFYNDLINANADLSVGRMFSDRENRVTTGNLEIWQGKESLINFLEDHPALYGCCNRLYRRSLIKDIRFVEGKKVHEDGFFNFSALIKLPTITVRDQCTYIYRTNLESASHAPFSEKYFDVLYFEELERKIIEEKYPELLDKAYNGLVKAHITMLHLFCKTKDKQYKKDIKSSIRMVREYGKYFIPAIPGEKKFFLIVKYGGYWLFRRLYWIKYRKQM